MGTQVPSEPSLFWHIFLKMRNNFLPSYQEKEAQEKATPQIMKDAGMKKTGLFPNVAQVGTKN